MKTEAPASQSTAKYVILIQHGESHSDDMYSLSLLLHLNMFYYVVLYWGFY